MQSSGEVRDREGQIKADGEEENEDEERLKSQTCYSKVSGN